MMALTETRNTLADLPPVLDKDPTLTLANAIVFLEVFGHTVIVWMWMRQALAARRGVVRGNDSDEESYFGKLSACRWFFRWELPKTRQWHELIFGLDDTTLRTKSE